MKWPDIDCRMYCTETCTLLGSSAGLVDAQTGVKTPFAQGRNGTSLLLRCVLNQISLVHKIYYKHWKQNLLLRY